MAKILILGRNYSGVSSRAGRHLKRCGHTVTKVTTYQSLLSLIHKYRIAGNATTSRTPFDMVLIHNYTDYEDNRFDEVRIVSELKILLPLSENSMFYILDPLPEAAREFEDTPVIAIHSLILDYNKMPEWDIIRLLAAIKDSGF